MKKYFFLGSFLILALAVLSAFSLPAHAGVGDFKFMWGAGIHFNEPNGIAVDATGNVYVADTHNNRIQVFNSSGAPILDSLGNPLIWGSYGSGNGQFNLPSGIAVGGTGTVYVADTANNRIQVFNSSGAPILDSLGNPLIWGSYGSGNGQFNLPSGIAVGGTGTVYVADTANNRIQVFNSSGAPILDSSGNPLIWGSDGIENGQFKTPSGIAVGGNGDVYVADTGNHRIQKFSSQGVFMEKWGLDYCELYGADCSEPTSGTLHGEFWSPSGIAVDGGANVYVADTRNKRIQKFNISSSIWGVLLDESSSPIVNFFGVAVDATGNVYVVDSNWNTNLWKFDGSTWGPFHIGYLDFSGPAGVAVDKTGIVFVTDTGNNRIQVFESSGSYIRQWGIQGTGDGQFNYPEGIAIDKSGNVYVADTGNNRIQVFDNTGAALIMQWGSFGTDDGKFQFPTSLALDGVGNIYVVDSGNHRIQVFDSTGTFLRKWGVNGSEVGNFSSPEGIAIDAGGNVYVTDTGNNRIQVFSSLGAYGRQLNTDENQPYGIAVDPAGHVYVSYFSTHQMQVFENSGTSIKLWGSQGDNDGQFKNPQGIALDACGTQVYVVDSANNRIQVFEGLASGGGELKANAGDDQIVEQTSLAGAEVILDGSKSTAGCGGAIEEYEWTWPGGSASGKNPPVTLPAGKTTVALRVRSGTAWSQPDTADIVVWDTTKPHTTVSGISGTAGNNGWYTSNVTLSLNAADSGSGIREIHSQMGAALESVAYTSAISSYTAPFELALEGSNQVKYYAVDNAIVVQGNIAPNVEDAHFTDVINIDKTPPTITGSRTPLANSYGWNNSVVTVQFTALDPSPGSGLDTVTPETSISTEGENQSLTGTAMDKAGNSASTTVSGISIDKTPPSIAISGIQDGSTYSLCKLPTAGFAATDDRSGIATQSGTLSGGGAATGVGKYKYTVSATDKADNASSKAASYSVNYVFTGFLPPLGFFEHFKQGWPIPVMFWLTDGCKRPVPKAHAEIWLQQYSDSGQLVGTPIPGKSKDRNVSNNVFSYDKFFKLYYFNLDTKNLSAGKWQIIVRLDDETVHTEFIEIFTK